MLVKYQRLLLCSWLIMQNLMLLFVSAVVLSKKIICLGCSVRVEVGGDTIYTVGVFFRKESNKSFSEELQ